MARKKKPTTKFLQDLVEVEIQPRSQVRELQITGMLPDYLRAFKMGGCEIYLSWQEKTGYVVRIGTLKRLPKMTEVVHIAHKLFTPDKNYMVIEIPTLETDHNEEFFVFLSEQDPPTDDRKMTPPEDHEEVIAWKEFEELDSTEITKEDP